MAQKQHFFCCSKQISANIENFQKTKSIIQERLENEDIFLNEIEQMFNQEIIAKAKRTFAKYKIFSDNVIIALPKVKDEKENTNRIEKICKFAS